MDPGIRSLGAVSIQLAVTKPRGAATRRATSGKRRRRALRSWRRFRNPSSKRSGDPKESNRNSPGVEDPGNARPGARPGWVVLHAVASSLAKGFCPECDQSLRTKSSSLCLASRMSSSGSEGIEAGSAERTNSPSFALRIDGLSATGPILTCPSSSTMSTESPIAQAEPVSHALGDDNEPTERIFSANDNCHYGVVIGNGPLRHNA